MTTTQACFNGTYLCLRRSYLTVWKPGRYVTLLAVVKCSSSAVDSRVVLSSWVNQFRPRPKLRDWQDPFEGTTMVVFPVFALVRMMRSVP